MSQLTQREFLNLDDAIHAAQVEVKCFADLAQHCQEPVVRDLCLTLSQMHLRHAERLYRYIQNGQGKQPYMQTQQTQAGAYAYSQPRM